MEITKLKSLYDSGKFAELELECNKLEEKGEVNADVINLLALSYKNLGKTDLAIKVFKKGILDFPQEGGLLGNLANIYTAAGELKKALEYLDRAIELTPTNPNLHSSQGYVFMQREQHDKACASFRKALDIEPGNSTFRYNVANIYRKMNKLKNAIAYFEGVDIGLSQSHLAECLYLDGQYGKLSEKLVELNGRKVTDPLIGALTEHTRITLDQKGTNAFCSRPLSHIYRANIDLSGSTGKTLQAIKDFAYSKAQEYKTQTQQALLINGVQSPGNLLNSNQTFVEPLRKILKQSIAAYRKKFCHSQEPFLKYWPKDYELYAWLVIMSNKGFLKAHIHKEGWLSGSLYLDLPKTNMYNEGTISFGLHGANYPHMGKTFKEYPVQIEEGLVCMFPSSLFHKTVPFQSSETRISLAFDVIPR